MPLMSISRRTLSGNTKLIGCHAYSFSRAAITKDHRQSGLKKGDLFSHSSRSWHSEVKLSGVQFLLRPLPWLIDGCLSPVPSPCLLCVCVCVCVCVWDNHFFLQGEQSCWIYLPKWPPFNFITSLKTPSPNTSHILRYKGVRTSIYEFGRGHSSVHSIL